MAKEIERKFLVTNCHYREMSECVVEIVQGYLSTDSRSTVRVRISGNKGYLTVKGLTSGCTRDEWEYEIPVDDAREMLRLADGVISKNRWIVRYDGFCWEVDEFGGNLAPLTVAEIEIVDENTEFTLPPFVGREVTGDPGYYNSNLVKQIKS